METLVSSPLPFLPAQAMPQVLQLDDIQAFSGAEFLQTLAALSAGAPLAQAGAPLVQGLNVQPDKQTEEAEEPVDATFALQWLPLTQFIASAIAHKADAPPPPTGEEGGSAVLQTAAALNATAAVAITVAATASARKPLPATDSATAVPDSLLPAASEEVSQQPVVTAASADADFASNLAALSDRPANALSGANALAATASAAGTLQVSAAAGSAQGATPLNAEQTVQAHIKSPVHSARWAQEIGQRITLMTTSGQQNGMLTLTPENMGPLEVRINVSQDTANVWFGAQQADTRAALVDAMPRLREMFAANGLSLGEANVSHETPRQDSEAARAFRGETGGIDDMGTHESPRAHRVSLGMIDTYA